MATNVYVTNIKYITEVDQSDYGSEKMQLFILNKCLILKALKEKGI